MRDAPKGGGTMRFRYWMSAAVLMTALLLLVDAAAAFDDTLYPDLKGQWRRAGNAGLLSGGAELPRRFASSRS